MANPLFENNGNARGPAQGGGVFGLIFNKMYKTNPQFRDFANSMKGKSLEQAYAEKGFDYNRYRNMSDQDMLDVMSKNGLM